MNAFRIGNYLRLIHTNSGLHVLSSRTPLWITSRQRKWQAPLCSAKKPMVMLQQNIPCKAERLNVLCQGEEPIPLLHHIVAQLLMSTKNPTTNPRIPIAYLCLLCTWLYDSPNSVTIFLSESTHIQFVRLKKKRSRH